jgi:signal peptidase I
MYAGRPWLAGGWFLATFGIGMAAVGSVLFLPASASAVALFLLLAATTPLMGAVLAWRAARLAPIPFAAQRFNRSSAYIACGTLIALAGTLFLNRLIRPHFVQAFRNPTGSMAPTLMIGDYFLVDRFRERDPVSGRVVAFESVEEPGLEVIKRIVAVGGDTIRGRADSIIVNGRALPSLTESPLTPEAIADTMSLRMLASLHTRFASADSSTWTLQAWGPLVVPQGSFFALGDSRGESYDSRYYGPVPSNRIRGWPRVIYFSLEGGGIRWSRIGLAIE